MLNAEQQKHFQVHENRAMLLSKDHAPNVSMLNRLDCLASGMHAVLEFWRQHPEASAESVYEYMRLHKKQL